MGRRGSPPGEEASLFTALTVAFDEGADARVECRPLIATGSAVTQLARSATATRPTRRPFLLFSCLMVFPCLMVGPRRSDGSAERGG